MENEPGGVVGGEDDGVGLLEIVECTGSADGSHRIEREKGYRLDAW